MPGSQHGKGELREGSGIQCRIRRRGGVRRGSRIEQAADAVIRITTANICGSDLHPYEGRAPPDAGMGLGPENMGVVEEVGSGVDRISIGDRVSVSPGDTVAVFGAGPVGLMAADSAALRGAAQV